jgi:LysM repeat protein
MRPSLSALCSCLGFFLGSTLGIADVTNGLDCDMNRGQLAFLVLVNAMVSLVIALAVVWAFEARRPDPEELAAISTPRPTPILAAPAAQPTATNDPAAATPEVIVPSPTPTPETQVEAVEEVYVVQPGDTMLVIATRYNVSVEAILAANNLSDPNFVFAGQRLVIPVEGSSPVTETVSSEEVPTAAPVVQGVRITEITSPGDLANEQVVIVNEGDAPFTLQGWQLQRGGGPAYTFLSDVPVFPGGSVRLHSAGGTNTTIDLYWGLTEPAWQQGVEARLLNAQGDVINTYTVP